MTCPHCLNPLPYLMVSSHCWQKFDPETDDYWDTEVTDTEDILCPHCWQSIGTDIDTVTESLTGVA